MSHSSAGVIGGSRPYNPMEPSPGKLFVSVSSTYSNWYFWMTAWSSTGYIKVKYSWQPGSEVRGNGQTIQYDPNGNVRWDVGSIDLSNPIPSSGQRGIIIESCDENGMPSGSITGLSFDSGQLNISTEKLANLTDLEFLNLTGSTMYSADFVNSLPSLETIYIGGVNGLIGLDFTTHPSIKNIYIENCNDLITVNAPNKTLERFYINDCWNLTNVNVSNSEIGTFYIYRGKYTTNTLNITGVTSNRFTIGGVNTLTNFDLSVCGPLAYDMTDPHGCWLEIMDIYNTENFEIGNRPEVKSIYFSYLNNVDPSEYFSDFPNIEKFMIMGQEFKNSTYTLDDGNQYGGLLDLTGFSNLKDVNVSDTHYGKVDISTNTLLERITSQLNGWMMAGYVTGASGNLTLHEGQVDGATGNNFISNYPNLKSLYINNSPGFIDGNVDASNNLNLRYVNLSQTNLSSVNFSNCTNLGTQDPENPWSGTEVRLDNIHVDSLNLDGCTGIQYLYIFNALNSAVSTSYDLTGLTGLKHLIVIDWSATELLINGLSNLETLNLGMSNISSLDTTGCISLKSLECSLWGVPFKLPNSQVDALITFLDQNGVTNGYIYFQPYTTGYGYRTSATEQAMQNLQNKGWRIYVQQA